MRKPLLASLLMCTACITTTYNGQQLMAMTDDQLCAAVHADPMNIRTVTFMRGRKLECHPAMETCKAAGYKSGSKDYGACVRTLIEQLGNERRARLEAARALYLSGGLSPPPRTNALLSDADPDPYALHGLWKYRNCTTS